MTARPWPVRGRRNLLRTGVVAASAAVLTLTALSAVNGTASATVNNPPPAPVQPANTTGLPPGGLLTLETGTTTGANIVKYFANASSATPTSTQPLINVTGNCKMDTTNQPLLAFGGSIAAGAFSSANVGLQNGSIGVADKLTKPNCQRVSTAAGEALRLDVTVGDASATPPVATSAYLDLEIKGNARVQAVAYLGTTQVGVYELQSGNTIGSATPLPAGAPSTPATVCGKPQTTMIDDRNDDDGGPDNCRWPISTPSWLGADDGVAFDSLVLTPVNGSFSLEGGADGYVLPVPPAGFPIKASFFELAGGVLPCSAKTDVVPGSAGGNVPDVFIAQLSTLATGDPCSTGNVPFTLTNGTNSITFLKNLAQQPYAQFVVNPTWYVPIVAGVPVTTNTQVTFPNGGAQTVNLCPGPVFDLPLPPHVLLSISDPLNPAKDMDPITGGVQYACRADRSETVVTIAGIDYNKVVEQIYLEGDVGFNRN